jgi:hypothetical protein
MADMTTKAPRAAAAAAKTQRPDTLTIKLPLSDGTERPMEANYPTEGQLVVWQSAGERFARLGEDWARREAALASVAEDDPRWAAFRKERAGQAANTLSRALSMIRAALAQEADRNWLEDRLLYGDMDLGDALRIVTLITEAVSRLSVVEGAADKRTPPNKPRLTA